MAKPFGYYNECHRIDSGEVVKAHFDRIVSSELHMDGLPGYAWRSTPLYTQETVEPLDIVDECPELGQFAHED